MVSIQEKFDITYFEETLNKLKEMNKVPLIEKRQERHKDDPIIELNEIYEDVNEIEANLAKAISIASLIIKKNEEQEFTIAFC